MALKPCRECSHKISTEANSCPNCGAKNPTGSRISAKQGCLGCLGLIVLMVIMTSLINTCGSGSTPSSSVMSHSRVNPSVNPDSVWAAGNASQLGSLSRRDSMRYDHITRTTGLTPAEPKFHERVVAMRIADARDASKRPESRGDALTFLSLADTPFTSTQSAAIKSLRTSISASIDRDTRKAGIPLRRAYAATLRNKFLDDALDIKVSALGDDATTLKLEFVLFNDVWSHKLVTGEFQQLLRQMGFKRLRMTDGYDWGYYWDL